MGKEVCYDRNLACDRYDRLFYQRLFKQIEKKLPDLG